MPASLTRLLYEQNELPVLQNRVYETVEAAKACPKGDMRLVEDCETGLVWNAAFRPELLVYDANYQNEQGLSQLFQHHLKSVMEIVDRSMGRAALIEIGCGKGLFLEMLLAAGFDVTGFDPTYEGANHRIRKQHFRPGVAISGNGLILRHVLEHIPDPFAFLLQLAEANGANGRIYIEVPCFDWICAHRAWFDVYYEHVNYFRLGDFHKMFGTILESGRLFGGQYLYVVADLSSLRSPRLDSFDRVSIPPGFANLAGTVEAESEGIAIWGAGSKGVVFSLLRMRAGQKISAVIDINPAKQGKYLPSTGLLVLAPEQGLASLPRGTRMYVMNSNYLEEIRTLSKNAYIYASIDHG